MPTRPAVPNVIKHEVLFLLDAGGFYERMVTTLWVEHAGAPTQDMVDADRTVIRNWANDVGAPGWAATSSAGYRVEQIKSWDFSVSPPAKFPTDAVYPGTDIHGGVAAGILPPQVCPVISLRTGEEGTADKPPHGRVYHVGVRNDYIGNYGVILGSNHTNLLAAWNWLLTNFDFMDDRGRWVVISFWSGGTRAVPNPRPSPLVLPITHLQMSTWLATVRSRRARQPVFPGN